MYGESNDDQWGVALPFIGTVGERDSRWLGGPNKESSEDRMGGPILYGKKKDVGTIIILIWFNIYRSETFAHGVPIKV